MRSTMVFGALLLAGAGVGGGVIAGCASAPPVNERTITTQAAIRAAGEVGAASVPRASLHLQLAKEESEKAKLLADSGDKERAASLLLRAEADAELAVTLAREDAERTEANAAVERVHQLRQSN